MSLSAMPELVPLQGLSGVRGYAIVDEDDAPWLSRHSWHLHSAGYACRTFWPGGCVLMHREILGLKPGDQRIGDHINGDRLDNRKANLRVLEHDGLNRQNMKAGRGTSRFRGVSESRGRWKAQVQLDGHNKFLGRFDTELEAALVAEAYRFLFMPFAEPDPQLGFWTVFAHREAKAVWRERWAMRHA